jgi:hypothetical protein
MTVVEIRPDCLDWKVLNRQASSVYFRRSATQSITRRAAPASAQGEFRILNSTGKLQRTIAFTRADRRL